MFTRCPSCGTVFNISDQQLVVADGSVRCGACEIIFDARLSLFAKIDYTPDQDSEVDVAAEADIILPTSIVTTGNGDQEVSLDPVNSPSQAPIPETISDQISALEDKTKSSSLLNVLGLASLLLLSGLLALQITAINKPRLLPTPIQASVCKWLKCANPTALDQIQILNRDIYTHAEVEDALTVSMTMINRAEFAQPFPLLELRLFDVAGDVIVARRFSPDEYLPFEWSASNLFPHSKAISLHLDLVDPGQQVVGYEFNFL